MAAARQATCRYLHSHSYQRRNADISQAQDVEQNALYLATVSIGTPAQKLTLDFDTGSADLWVWSTELPSSITSSSSGKGHAVFDPSKSSTFKNTEGSTWQISYGDGSGASGTVGTDTLVLGGISVENQSIELANKLSTQFVQSEGDGLLGLAFGSINTVQPTPVATPVEVRERRIQPNQSRGLDLNSVLAYQRQDEQYKF